jgi:hypothetical protein
VTDFKSVAQAEKVIREAEGSFIVIGEALAAVRDQCLFSKGNSKTETFEAWAAENFDWSKVQAYRLIGASAIAKMAAQLGFKLNERQARELKGLENDPELLENILAKAKEDSENSRITARSIRDVRDKLANPDKELQNPMSEASEAAEDPALGDDPNSGEDWNGVLVAAKRSVGKMTKELPAQLMADWARTLEANAKKARRRAQAGA